jgi:ABC-type branched-subunit amino acid transport system substrate-binding protein
VVQAPPPPKAVAPPSAPRALVDTGNRTNVALLLPLSGANAALGQELLDAAELALSEIGGKDLVLTPKDTAGTPAGAAEAAHQAIEENARLIIGPLTAGEVSAVKPIASAAGVNLLAFSNQAQVAGGGVWLLGFMPQQEIERVVHYAKDSGIGVFGALAPTNAYGRLATDALRSAVTAVGAEMGPVGAYDANVADLTAQAKRLAVAKPDGLGALLLPEANPARLRDLAALLPTLGLDQPKIRYLGTGVWNRPDIGQEPGLVGGWFAGPPLASRQEFERRYQTVYGKRPQALTSLAYDAVGVAAVLNRTPGARFDAASLTNPSGFAGPDGVFRFMPDGSTQRLLAVLQVESNGLSIASPAAESFAGPGQ